MSDEEKRRGDVRGPHGAVKRQASPDALVSEMTDKLSWAIGSTLGEGYGRQSSTFKWAREKAEAIVERYLTRA